MSIVWIAVAGCYLGMHTVWEVDDGFFPIGAVPYVAPPFRLQSRVRWEDETVRTGLEAHIDGAARLMKICSEDAGRRAVQYIRDVS